MTTIYVDSRKRVAGSDSDFEVDLAESLHLQSDPVQSPKRGVYPVQVAAAISREEAVGDSDLVDGQCGVAAQGRLHGLPAGRLDQLQLRYCRLQRDHEQPQRSLRRQPPHSERSGAAAAVP